MSTNGIGPGAPHGAGPEGVVLKEAIPEAPGMRSVVTILKEHRDDRTEVNVRDLEGWFRSYLHRFVAQGGDIRISKERYNFPGRPAAIPNTLLIKFTPFGSFGEFFISIKRVFVGVTFDPSANPAEGRSALSQCVFNEVEPGTPPHTQAVNQLLEAKAQGRRIVCAIALNPDDVQGAPLVDIDVEDNTPWFAFGARGFGFLGRGTRV